MQCAADYFLKVEIGCTFVSGIVFFSKTLLPTAGWALPDMNSMRKKSLCSKVTVQE